MQIRMFITMAMLSCGFFTPIKLFSTNRAPTPDYCWSLLSSCWNRVNKNPQDEMEIKCVYGQLNTLIANEKPDEKRDEKRGVLRELYLKCQSSICFSKSYDLTPNVKSDLIKLEIIDTEGCVKNPEIILNFLLFNNDTLDPSDWYFHQQVRDLAIRYPEIISALEETTETENVSTSHLETLFNQYHLISNKGSITSEQRRFIVAESKQQARGPFGLKTIKEYRKSSASSVVIREER